MAPSAWAPQTSQLVAGNLKNNSDSSAVYSAGAWDLRNASGTTTFAVSSAGAVTAGVAGVDNIHVFRGKIAAYGDGTSQDPTIDFYDTADDGSSPVRKWAIGNWAGPSHALTVSDASAVVGLCAQGGAWTFGPTSGGVVHGVFGKDAAGNIDNASLILRHQSSGTPQCLYFLVDKTNGWSGFRATDATGCGTSIRIYGGTTYATFAQGGSSWSFSSDSRLKENIRPISYGLSEIINLKPIHFNYLDTPSVPNLGFIAQEVEPLLPELITESAEGYKQLAQTGMIPVLVKAIQELSAKLDEANARIAALEAK
jgi:hypothetical protein